MKRSTGPVLLLGVLALLVATVARAEAPAAAADPKIEKIRASLAVFLPRLQVDHIGPSAVEGLYEVAFGSRLMYVSEDGRYLVQGAVFDLEGQEDLTKPRLAQLRSKAVNAIGDANMLTYEPETTKHTVTVFTDIDCPYCRKMHDQMDEYLAKGIRIRYLFYPRAGKQSESYNKAVSVWCADDRITAMNTAKSGGKLDSRSCANPVDAHMALAEKLPIRGTPAIVLESGEVIPGYVPPDNLLKALEEDDKN